MERQDELHALFSDLMASVVGVENTHVYFQPPEGFKIEYPCIIYELDRISIMYANNVPYSQAARYSLTLIDRDPVSELPFRIAELPYCRHDRRFVTDNLYHDTFTIY